MKKFINEGTLDRLIRFLISEIFFILAYFWFSGTLQIIFYVLGFITLVTAITGFCGLYKILHINTAKKGK